MNYLKILTVILIINSTLITAQQNYHFKVFPGSEKLSNLQINDIFQDSYGFMWIVTADGLNRYDGKSVKIYKNIQGDKESLPDNYTAQIVEDKDKNLWVGCYNSIGKLDRKTDKFNNYTLDHLSFKSPPTFYGSMLDNQDKIWFSTNQLGLLQFDDSSDQFINIELSELNKNNTWGEVHNVSQLRNGLILAVDVSEGIKAYNPSTNKFDPYYLKPNYSPKGLYQIYESSDGSVWFVGGGKLIKYSPIQYSVKEVNLAKYSKINSKYDGHNGIVEDAQGNMWVSLYTHGLFKFDKQFSKIEQYVNEPGNLHSLTNNRTGEIYIDKYGIIWITYFVGNGITQLDPNSNPFDLHSLNLSTKNSNQIIVTSIVPSLNNQSELILGTNSSGILKYNLEQNNSEKLNLVDFSIKKDSNNSVNDLAIDYQGNIWYSINNSQLKKYDIITKKVETIISPHIGKTAQPLDINSIKVSPDNKIWISSNFGVDRYDPATNNFFSVPRIMNKRMNQELRNKIDEIRESRKPLSSILKVDEGKNLEEPLRLQNDSKVLIITVGEGRAIGGMFDSGRLMDSKGNSIWEMSDIYKTFYDGGGFKNRIGLKALTLSEGEYQLSYYSDIGHSYKDWNTLAPDDSNHWGIAAYELNDEEFGNLSKSIESEVKNVYSLPFERGRVVEFSKTNSNTVWIGTNTNSFFQYDLITNTYTQYNYDKNNPSDASHFIYSFYEDLDGIIWVGTYSSFVRLNPKTGMLNSFTTLDGLPGGNIYSIVEDNNGALWIYSSGGLSKLNKNAPIDKYTFVNYDVHDGLDGLAKTTAVWKSEEGRIYFGGKGGVISFFPGKINSVKPDIVIYDMKIDDESIFNNSSGFGLEDGIYEAANLDLSYNQNDIAFEFASIHFSRPGKNKISYQLEGFNNKWYESDRNYASFTNLDPGEYTFKVKGSNGDGVWNENGRSIDIVIDPPWWQTTWAYLGYGALFFLSLFAVDRIQRIRLLHKAKERMKIQEAEHRAEAAELQSKVMEAEHERKTKELEEARQLQLSMLPKELPQLPHLDIAVYMKTATEVGGDYYDFNIGMDGTLTVALGDATGHGMRAGTMVTTTKSLFNVLAPNPDIIETFHEMTRCLKLMQMNKLSMCMTMIKIIGNKIQMSAAGMPPVFISKKESQSIEEHVMKGMPLGTLSDFPYTLIESEISTGDTILMMSDGFPELMNSEKEMFGYKQAKNLFEEISGDSPENIITKLKDAGSDWTNDADPDDDVTFVVIKVK